MPISHIHSFARQVLAEQNCKIFSNDVEILPPFKGIYGGKIYDIPRLIDTKIPLGTSEFQPSEEIQKINLQKLNDLGLKIAATPWKGSQAWFSGQKQRYDLVKINSIKTPLKDIPNDHIVEYDTINRALRLKGKNASWNGVGEWIQLSHQKRETSPEKMDSTSRYLDARSKILGHTKEIQYLHIPEIPVFVDEDGWIICIEEQTNEPCVSVVGGRRMGNSFFMHALADRAYHKWNKHLAVLNDGLDETDTWCLPWEEHPAQPNKFIRNLSRLNEPTIPLPCVYFTPNWYKVQDGDLFYPTEVGFRTSLPFRDMMLDWDNFSKGNARWTFKNSWTYLRNIMFNDDGTLNEEFFGATSFEEIDQLMRDKWENAETGEIDKKYETVYMKLHDTLRDIWNWKILDAANDIPAKWKVKLPNGYEEELDPLVACIACNIVPVLLTRTMKNFSHFHQEFKYRLDQILKAQTENQYFKTQKIQIWIVVDEILDIASQDDLNVAAQKIREVVRVSGPARIGFLYRAQNYNRVLKELKKNTGYCFAFNQDEESAKSILKDFGFSGKKGKAYVDELTSLKRHQVMAFTKNRFIAYDPVTGERKIISGRPIKGNSELVPPISQHKAPKKYGA